MKSVEVDGSTSRRPRLRASKCVLRIMLSEVWAHGVPEVCYNSSALFDPFCLAQQARLGVSIAKATGTRNGIPDQRNVPLQKRYAGQTGLRRKEVSGSSSQKLFAVSHFGFTF